MRGSDEYPTDLSITGTYIVLFRISNVPPIDYIIKESERFMDVIIQNKFVIAVVIICIMNISPAVWITQYHITE